MRCPIKASSGSARVLGKVQVIGTTCRAAKPVVVKVVRGRYKDGASFKTKVAGTTWRCNKIRSGDIEVMFNCLARSGAKQLHWSFGR